MITVEPPPAVKGKRIEREYVLRMPPLGMTKYGYSATQEKMAELTFAAIAAAFHNLSETAKQRVWPGDHPDDPRNWRIEICPVAVGEDLRVWEKTWKERSAAARQPPELW